MRSLCKILHPGTLGRCSSGYFRMTISGPELLQQQHSQGFILCSRKLGKAGEERCGQTQGKAITTSIGSAQQGWDDAGRRSSFQNPTCWLCKVLRARQSFGGFLIPFGLWCCCCHFPASKRSGNSESVKFPLGKDWVRRSVEVQPFSSFLFLEVSRQDYEIQVLQHLCFPVTVKSTMKSIGSVGVFWEMG